MLLAVDTSTEVVSVALFEEQIRVEHTWRVGRNHTGELLRQIDNCLREDGLSVRDLSAVAVALGPGSFNGLRVGLATAKLLSFCLSIPLIGVDTLRITAYQYHYGAHFIRPLYDAGREQVATALYGVEDGELREIEVPRLAVLGEVLMNSVGPTLFCGEISERWRETIHRQMRGQAWVVSSAGSLRRAGYLAELGWLRCRAGRYDDPATLQPVYLRPPPVTKRRVHGAGV